MKYVLIGLLLSASAHADTVFKIGIFDSGYKKEWADPHVKLCPSGHYDYLTKRKVVNGTDPHGSVVASTMAQILKDVPHCFVVYQVMPDEDDSNARAEIIADAARRAAREGLVAVNISLRGNDYSFIEFKSLQLLTMRGTAVFAAAGNEESNLDALCNKYPACYDLENLFTVGALDPSGYYRAVYSNYGSRVKIWKQGHVKSGGGYHQGTSIATPRATADYVYSLWFLQNKK